MNRAVVALSFVLTLPALLSGCIAANPSVSGSYIASGSTTVDLLQLTESKDGQLLGSLSEFGYKADGSINRFSLSVTGTTDGHSITIVARPNGLPIGSMNISGTIDGSTIMLTTEDGTQKFMAARPGNFRSQESKLTQQATAIRIANARQEEQKRFASRMLDENNVVKTLASKLEDYAARVEAEHELSAFHAAHAKLLDAARHDLEIQKTFPKGSFAASQVDFRINQLAFQLNQFDIPWSNAVDQGKEHRREFGQAIASSPCHTSSDSLSGCSEEGEAEAAYAKAKTIAWGEDQDVISTIAQDHAAVKAITQQADLYDQE